MAFLFLEVSTWIGCALLTLLLLAIFYRRQSKKPAPSPDDSYIQWVNYSAQKTREPPLAPSVRESSPESQEPVSVTAPVTTPAKDTGAVSRESTAEPPAQAATTPLPAILDFD